MFRWDLVGLVAFVCLVKEYRLLLVNWRATDASKLFQETYVLLLYTNQGLLLRHTSEELVVFQLVHERLPS